MKNAYLIDFIGFMIAKAKNISRLFSMIYKASGNRCWGIEIWHRILKSGCHLEARQFRKAGRLHRALALYSILAWRIVYATMLARAVPEAPCSVLLEPDEWQALYCAIHRVPTPPANPPTLGQAVPWIAQLGGFVGRRRRDRPGAEVMWRGFQHLGDLTTMYCIMRRDSP